MEAGRIRRRDTRRDAEGGAAPPSYRERLRVEGLVLAASAAVATLALLIGAADSRTGIGATLIVLAIALLLIAWLAPRSVHLALRRASQLFTPDLGTGQPRALWQLPLLVAIPVVVFAKLGGAAMGLRLAVILLILGLVQAFMLERIVAVFEGQARRRFYRVEGSKMLGATKLGYVQRRVR